mgnify:CR=1 FL=1
MLSIIGTVCGFIGGYALCWLCTHWKMQEMEKTIQIQRLDLMHIALEITSDEYREELHRVQHGF